MSSQGHWKLRYKDASGTWKEQTYPDKPTADVVRAKLNATSGIAEVTLTWIDLVK